MGSTGKLSSFQQNAPSFMHFPQWNTLESNISSSFLNKKLKENAKKKKKNGDKVKLSGEFFSNENFLKIKY